MGILDFFKKKDEKVKFSELETWLDTQVEAKQLDKKIEFANEEIKKLIALCKQSLLDLEHAALMNDQIPVREKQIMEGHRKIYIQKISSFLEKINLPKDFSQIGHYGARFSETIASLATETAKNHYVLKQFFEVELNKTTAHVKSIENIISKLQSDIEKAGVEDIKNAKLKLKEYKDDKARKENLEKNLTSIKDEKTNHQRKKEKIDSRLENLKRSTEYEQFRACIDSKQKSEEEIAALETKLVSHFAEISRQLKKFTHATEKQKHAEKYLNDPVDAIFEDEEVKIANILDEMSEKLEELELKDNQLEKIKSHIKTNLSKEELKKLKQKMSELKQMSKDLATKINRSVVALNVSESESLLKSIQHKLQEIEKEEEKLQKELNDINIDYLKQKAKEKIRDINKKIIIEDEN